MFALPFFILEGQMFDVMFSGKPHRKDRRTWKAILPLVLIVLVFALYGCSGTETTTTETTTEQRTTDASGLGQYGLVGAINEEVSFGLADFTIHGTLSIPDKSREKYPAVVLVGGSGPTDRDETIGANKFFKELAQQLVDAGIIVLRYDKRTLTHVDAFSSNPDNYKNMTIYDEVVDDAVYAVNYLLNDPHVDKERIFVIGHSFGGYLAPEIANNAGSSKLAGIVMLAANYTSILDLMVEQFEYISAVDGVVTPQEQTAIDRVRAARDYIQSPDYGESSDYSQSLQIYPPYWLSLNNYDPVKVIGGLGGDVKIMIAQGGRDYQVPARDFEAWKSSIGERAEYRYYEDLNHLFISGTGASVPAEYLVPGNIFEKLVDDIISFIKN